MRNRNSRNPTRRQQGVALITTMLLLLLLTAMSLTMVLTVSSDMLLTGYYGNYRGSFYAADSGLNVARQQIITSLNGSIPANFNPSAGPLPSTAGSTAASSISNAGGWGTISTAYSWPEKYKVTAQVPAVGQPIICAPQGGTTTNCASPYAQPSDAATSPVTSYTYKIPYSITAYGQSQGTEVATISESGTINLVANTGLAPVTTSFAGFGMFIDQYALCG